MIKVGVIGLGNSGRRMALSLTRGGHQVIGFDVLEATRAAVEEVVTGAGGIATISQLGEREALATNLQTL